MNTASKFSAKVLERKASKRRARRAVMHSYTLMLGFITFLGLAVYKMHVTEKNNVPTWADFVPMQPSDARYELTNGVMPNGVPAQLTINGERWDLVLINHFDDVDMTKEAVDDPRMAQTDCEHRTISYITAADPARLKINLMHEVFHAGACLHGGATYWNSPANEDPNHPHPGIYHLGEFTSTFLHDNPQFATWEAQ